MSFEGTWNLSITSPMGTQAVTAVITLDNGQVAGTATLGSDTAAFQEPVLEGDRLRWAMDITKPMKLNIKFEITLDGDTVKGTAKAGFFVTAAVTGVRVVPTA